MRETAIWQIERAISGELLSGVRDDTVTGVSTDSRRAGRGDVFFALSGKNGDGHDFICGAVQNGAKCVVVSKDNTPVSYAGVSVIKTADTTKALHDFTKWYIADLGIRTIGITGSTGKTTTKDMLYHICCEKYRTGCTIGNLNTHTGLPLTVFSFDAGVEIGVLEMGAEEIGEIHLLADIARPAVSVITNIGVSHIESFGSRENILKGKMEITDFLGENGLLVFNAENDMLTKDNVSGPYRLAAVGSSEESDYILSDVSELGGDGIEFTLSHNGIIKAFRLGIPGRHNAMNASLAIAAAGGVGISMDEAERGLAKAVLSENRLNIREKNGIKVINDTYNASPDSMRAAIGVLLSVSGARKIAVLADMLGLGGESKFYHEQIGEFIAASNIDILISTGKMAKCIAEKAKETMGEDRVVHFDGREQLEAKIRDIASPGDVILVKGSRAMGMESVAGKLLE